MEFNLDAIIMVAYLLGMLILGVYCSRFIKTFDDFFVAGRRLGFFLSMGTMSALFVGGSAIGISGMGHDYGIGAIWYYVAYGIGFVALAMTFVVPLRALNEYTCSDIFAHRYGEKVRLASSIITFVAWILFFAAFVVAGARVVEALLGWPLWLSILLTAGIFTIYTSVGGMWAVTMTDFVQFVILVAGLLVIFPVSLMAVGGFEGLAAGLPEGFFSLIPQFEGKTTFDGVGYVVATLVVTGMTGIVGPDVYIRVWCAKDNTTAKRVLYAVGGLIVVGAVMLVLIGMAARVLNPSIEHEMAMPWMISHLLPAGVSGLVLVALMAAAISGAVPELVVCSSILARDVYQRVFSPEADQKKLLKASRILTFLVGCAGMVMAVSLPNFMDLTYHCYRVFVPAIAPITIAAFYSKKTNETSAFWSMLAGAGTALLCIVAFPESYLTFADPVIVGLAASVFVLLVLNRFTKSKDPERGIEFVDQAQEQIAAYKAERKAARLEKKGREAA